MRELLLKVNDDGKGFCESEAGSSLGLLGMKERAQACGGDVQVSSSPGQGTTVSVRIPLRAADAIRRTMRILIADDHAIVRRGLMEILADAIPGACFSEAGRGDEILSSLAWSETSLVVLDINMPGRSGLDVLRDIKRMYPRLPVIVLSMQPEDQYAFRCLRAGAAAYINKSSAPEELALATKKILGGGRYISPQFAEKLIDRIDESGGKPLHDSLSDREYEVMRMIASGTTLTEIAETLHLSVKTVSTYRARILEKMKMTTNAELVRYTLKHELID